MNSTNVSITAGGPATGGIGGDAPVLPTSTTTSLPLNNTNNSNTPTPNNNSNNSNNNNNATNINNSNNNSSSLPSTTTPLDGWVEPFVEPVNGLYHPIWDPPPEKPHRNTNQLQYLLKMHKASLMKHQYAWPFKSPVDTIKLGLPDYFKIITRPMDLTTIKKRLEAFYYYEAKEAIADYRLLFTDCYSYNKPGEDIVVMCKDLEHFFNQKLSDMPQEEVVYFACINGQHHPLHPQPQGKKSSSKGSSVKSVKKPVIKQEPPSFTRHQPLPPAPATSLLSTTLPTPRPSLPILPPISNTGLASSTMAPPPPLPVVPAAPLPSTPQINTTSSSRIVKKLSKDYDPSPSVPGSSSGLVIGNGQSGLGSKRKRKISDKMKHCKQILTELFNKKHHPYAWPFYQPVDVKDLGLDDYFDIIKKPMDLGTAKEKMKRSEYRTPAEFAADIRLIFTNCYKYNPPEHEIVSMGRKLQDVFEMRYAKIPDDDGESDHGLSSDSGSSSSDDSTDSEDEADRKRLKVLIEQMRKISAEIDSLQKKQNLKKKKTRRRTRSKDVKPNNDYGKDSGFHGNSIGDQYGMHDSSIGHGEYSLFFYDLSSF